MKLFIVRHGQTNYNTKGLINYDPNIDVHLTSEGMEQARLVGQQLADENFDAVFVSELPRTHETARLIRPDANLNVDPRLADIRNGFEGRIISEFKALRAQSNDEYNFRYTPDVESSKDVYDRVADFLSDLRQHDYSSVLIVTSAHPWRHFRNLLDQRDPATSLHENIANAELLIREI